MDTPRFRTTVQEVLNLDTVAEHLLKRDQAGECYQYQVELGKKLVELRTIVNLEIDQVALECEDFAEWLELRARRIA